MENREVLRKRSGMKVHFVINRFLVYFAMFTLPVILLGAVLSYRMYDTFAEELDERMENSLKLCADTLESYIADAKALNMYIENGSQMLYFYKMFQNEEVDYTSYLTMNHLSAYLISLESSKVSIDSVYFYMDNRLDRILTSDMLIMDRNNMYDKGWWNEFDTMGPGEIKIVSRTMQKDRYMEPCQVYSVFSRFQNYQGGTVINYKTETVEQAMQMMLFYDEQVILCLNESGELLLANEGFASAQRAALIPDLQPDKRQFHTYRRAFQAPSFEVVTAIPDDTLFSYLFLNMQTIILIISMTILSSVILAYYHAVRNYNQLYSMIEIFDRAENNQELTVLPGEEHDIYSQILNNILRTFIRCSYLKVQLSERKYKQMAAELLALQYQINPHFLFNTLQAINYEILDVTGGTMTQANRMLEYLSDILRFSLTAPKKRITLDGEVENCKKYIAIQQMRHGNQFQAEWEIDGELKQMPVPRLLLQPLAENAISHGLRNKAAPAILRFRIGRHKDCARFTVVDNGCGIAPERLSELRESLAEDTGEFTSEHIGLRNINQRLILEYSPASSLHILSKPGMGTLIYFEISLMGAEETPDV